MTKPPTSPAVVKPPVIIEGTATGERAPGPATKPKYVTAAPAAAHTLSLVEGFSIGFGGLGMPGNCDVGPLFAAILNALAVCCIVHVPALSAYREAVVVSLEEECSSLDGFGSSMILPTTERSQSIAYKSATPTGAITTAGIHLVVQGINKINGR
jgi:hypothetical protein